jgi:hypothetical protein
VIKLYRERPAGRGALLAGVPWLSGAGGAHIWGMVRGPGFS